MNAEEVAKAAEEGRMEEEAAEEEGRMEEEAAAEEEVVDDGDVWAGDG